MFFCSLENLSASLSDRTPFLQIQFLKQLLPGLRLVQPLIQGFILLPAGTVFVRIHQHIRFRQDLGGVEAAYRQVMDRLNQQL